MFHSVSVRILSERHKQTVTHRKARLEPATEGCAEACAERFSALKMRRRQLKTRNHVVEEKENVNPNLLKTIAALTTTLVRRRGTVVRSGM